MTNERETSRTSGASKARTQISGPIPAGSPIVAARIGRLVMVGHSSTVAELYVRADHDGAANQVAAAGADQACHIGRQHGPTSAISACAESAGGPP